MTWPEIHRRLWMLALAEWVEWSVFEQESATKTRRRDN